MTNPNEKMIASTRGNDFVLEQNNTPKPQLSRTVAKEKTKARTTEFIDYTASNSEFKEAPQTETTNAQPTLNAAAVSDNYTFEIKAHYKNQDDADVSANAQLELTPLLKMMANDPKIEIEVGSHTSTTGKMPYNLTISQLRADNIKTYFIEKGIEPARIHSLGYGETMVRNRCKRGVNCTPTEHAQNPAAALNPAR